MSFAVWVDHRLFVNLAPMTDEVNGDQLLIVIHREKDSIITDAQFE